MRLPFTLDQFLGIFRQYNEAMWPSQWLLHVLAVFVIVLALRAVPQDGRRVSGILAFLWLWAGVIYHLSFFSTITGAALLFAALFIAQAIILFVIGVYQGRLVFRPRTDVAGFTGAVLVVYALLIYPLLGHSFGHRYPTLPTFGVPCPTTIFTLGILLWAKPPVPFVVLLAPLLWAVIATSAAVDLGMREDFGLTAAAIATTAIVLARRPRHDARPRGLEARA